MDIYELKQEGGETLGLYLHYANILEDLVGLQQKDALQGVVVRYWVEGADQPYGTQTAQSFLDEFLEDE